MDIWVTIGACCHAKSWGQHNSFSKAIRCSTVSALGLKAMIPRDAIMDDMGFCWIKLRNTIHCRVCRGKHSWVKLIIILLHHNNFRPFRKNPNLNHHSGTKEVAIVSPEHVRKLRWFVQKELWVLNDEFSRNEASACSWWPTSPWMLSTYMFFQTDAALQGTLPGWRNA